MAKISSYATATPAADDKVVGTDVSETGDDAGGATRNFTLSALLTFFQENFDGSDFLASDDASAFGLTLLDDADDATARETLGIGSGDNLLLTAAQSTAIGTALQPGAEIPWTDVTEKPTFGTAAAADTGDFATAGHDHDSDYAGIAVETTVEIVTVSSSRTLIASDAGKVLRVTADATLTVDDGVFSAGQVVTIRVAGAAVTATIADGTATVTQVEGYAKTIGTDRAQATLHFVAADAADLTGGLDAA